MQAFAKFGSDLDASTQAVLNHGERLTKLLVQGQYAPLSVTHQVLSLFAAKNQFLKNIALEDIEQYEKEMHTYMSENHADLVQEITDKGAIDDTLSEQLKAAFAQFETLFLSMRA